MEIKSIGKTAFDAVYDMYAETVYQVALYYSEDHHVAEDVTQEVFMKLYANMENINMANVGAWLKTTAKHRTWNIVRDHRREKCDLVAEIETMEDKILYMESVEDTFFQNLCTKERAELAEKIYGELYQFNELWYEAVTITYILEKPQKEVAETMGVSLNMLHTILFRAKKWIRKRYQKKFDHLDKV